MIQHNGLTYIFTKAALDEMSMPQQNKWVAVIDTNCPNCGAVITGPTCEYCGTRFRREVDSSKYVEADKYYNQAIELLAAKNKTIERHAELTNLYQEALRAMRNYTNTI